MKVKWKYKVIVKDTAKGMVASLYKKTLFGLFKTDESEPFPLAKSSFEKISKKIDDWDSLLNSVILIENNSRFCVLYL